MKRLIYKLCLILIIIILVFLSVVYYEDIYHFYLKYLDSSRKNITIDNNKYALNSSVKDIEIVNNFIATSEEELFNIYYTIVNSGTPTFTFYCDVEYENCINDVNKLSNNTDKLSIINDFVHPYNSFDTIKTTYTSNGMITVDIIKTYTNDQIELLNNKVTEIINKNITSKMSQKDQIKAIHDYIINNTKYNDNKQNKKISNTAYGVLFNGIGMCGGYSDTMALFLHQLNINNFKISNSVHVWNYVQLNEKWYHLDLTWDDPVTNNGTDTIKYYYYLIDEAKLNKLNDSEHDYEKQIYNPK